MCCSYLAPTGPPPRGLGCGAAMEDHDSDTSDEDMPKIDFINCDDVAAPPEYLDQVSSSAASSSAGPASGPAPVEPPPVKAPPEPVFVLEPHEGNVFLEPPSSGNDTTKVGHYITLEKIALPADIKQPGFFFHGNGFGAVVDTSEEELARDDCVLLEDLFQRQLFKNETDDHLYIKEKTSKTVWCLHHKMRQYRYGTATWSIAGGQSSSWPYWTVFWPRGVAVSEHVCIM